MESLNYSLKQFIQNSDSLIYVNFVLSGCKNTFHFLHRRIDFIDNLETFKCRPTVSYRLLVDGMLLLKSLDRIFN